jgi:hypothetical protein
VIDALKVWQKFNKGDVPQQIFFYRDAVGSPTMFEKIELYECDIIEQAIKSFS